MNVDIPSPLDSAARALSLQGLMQQTQLRNMQMQEAQRGLQDEQSLRDLFAPGAATPTTTDLIRAGGQRGLAVSKALLDQKTAELAQHKAILEDADLTRKAIEKTLGTATDNATKNQAIGEAVTKKWLTPEQASPLLNYDINDEGWKSYVSRIQQQTMDLGQRIDTAKKQLDIENAKHDEARKQAGFDVELPEKTAKAASAQWELAAQLAPNNQADWTTWRAKLPADMQAQIPEMFSPAAQAAVQLKGNKAEPGKTIPLPPAVQQQKIDERIAEGTAAANVQIGTQRALNQPLIDQANADPTGNFYRSLPAEKQTAIAAYVTNPKAFAKTLSDTELSKINNLQKGLNAAQALKTALGNPQFSSHIGPLTSLSRFFPGSTDTLTMQSKIDLVRQIVGKALEEGVLRKEDEEKYKKILPVMSDRFDVANNKIDQLVTLLQTDLGTYKQQLTGAGRQLPAQVGTPAAAPPKTTGRTVMMIAPDGSGQDVPIDQVEWYKSKGAKVWE